MTGRSTIIGILNENIKLSFYDVRFRTCKLKFKDKILKQEVIKVSAIHGTGNVEKYGHSKNFHYSPTSDISFVVLLLSFLGLF